MSQAVIEKAKELAGIIAQSPEYITMRATEDAAGQDEGLQELFKQYDSIHRDIEDATLKNEPDFDKSPAPVPGFAAGAEGLFGHDERGQRRALRRAESRRQPGRLQRQLLCLRRMRLINE